MDPTRLREIYRALDRVTRTQANVAKAEEKAKEARGHLQQLLSGAQSDLLLLGKAVGVTVSATPAMPSLAKTVGKRNRRVEMDLPEVIEIDEAAFERGRKRARRVMLAKGFVEVNPDED